MVTSASFRDQLQERIRTIEQLTSAVSDAQAGSAPAEGEWCVKEVLSHLTGSEARSFFDGIKSLVEQDTPTYDLTPGESFFDSARAVTDVAALRTSVIDQYSRIGDLLGDLSEQLARTAHMPNFKETPPPGEYPTLGTWAAGLINYHLPDHIAQLQTLCK